VNTTFNRRLFGVWLVLVGITLAYFWLDHAAGGGPRLTASTVVTVGAVCLALVKVRIIMREFMEVRRAPQLLCRLTDLLVVVMAAAMVGAYGAGRALS
jgi:hypothetical protein